jgi:hypothetical protein
VSADRLWDALALTGVLLVTVGLVAVYWPLAMIVPGIALVVLGVYGARFESRVRRKAEDDED